MTTKDKLINKSTITFFVNVKKKILLAEIQSHTSSYCSVSYHYPQASSRVQFFSFGHFLDMDTSNSLSHSRNKRDSSLVNVRPLLYDLLLVADSLGGVCSLKQWAAA